MHVDTPTVKVYAQENSVQKYEIFYSRRIKKEKHKVSSNWIFYVKEVKCPYRFSVKLKSKMISYQ